MDSPELTNFGSLIRYALELEAASAAFYEAASQLVRPGDAATCLRDLGTQHAARRRLLERTRQQTLNEMVLEPISGLDGARYVFDASLTAPSEVVTMATRLEEVGGRLYRESAAIARPLLTEGARTFRKLAEENEGNIARLRQAFGA